MSRRVGQEKIDLLAVLAMAAAEPDLNSGDYVACVREEFSCSMRAARDAISILKQAGWLDAYKDTRDRRALRYRLSRSGRQVLDSLNGRLLVRFARKLYTTCPSPHQAARQRRDPDGNQRKQQLRATHALLKPDSSRRIRLMLAMPPPAPAAAERPRDHVPQQLIVEPRCKVCRSPHRSKIDALLAAGHTQVDVRMHANKLAGAGHFTQTTSPPISTNTSTKPTRWYVYSWRHVWRANARISAVSTSRPSRWPKQA
jgi:DNA-binding MarR family transcriptional regulator